MTTLLSIAATLATGALLAWLGWRDPKRLRNRDKHSGAVVSSPDPLARSVRRMLAAAALVPGVLLAAAGAWHSFFIWLGALCTVGWTIAQLLSRVR
jgi:thiosulfate reductase cytochrome b subunit